MPLYNYRCDSCEHEFKEFLKISERNEPTNSPCPNCLQENCVYKCISSPRIADPVQCGVTKPSKGFTEGVLGRIKRNNKNTTIDV